MKFSKSFAKGMILFAATSTLVSCTNPKKQDAPAPERKTAQASQTPNSSQPAPELGEVQWTTKDEDYTNGLLSTTIGSLKPNQAGVTQRDAHSKALGCVKATVKLDSTPLPKELRQGIFSDEVSGHTYQSWIRFSNALPNADFEPGIRGMAIKLMGLPVGRNHFLAQQGMEPSSGTHDILMITMKDFAFLHLAEYSDFLEAATKKDLIGIGTFLATHPHEDIELAEANVEGSRGNLLGMRFSNSTPYKLGNNTVMKLGVEPCGFSFGGSTDGDFLSKQLGFDLKNKDQCFELNIRYITNPTKDAVDADTLPAHKLAWFKAKRAHVGHIVIKGIKNTNELTSTDRQSFCENLSFTPWRALPENRPLGKINRARLKVYETIAKYRHGKNNVNYSEPKP